VRGVHGEGADIAAGAPGHSGVRPWAIDRSAAERLRAKSEEWSGVRFEV